MSNDHFLKRRQSLELTAAAAAFSAAPNVLCSQQTQQQRFSRPKDHYSSGKNVAVTSTSREASESALWALKQGGNAADAYLTATLTQTVVEHGLTSICGGFSIKYYDSVTGKISSINKSRGHPKCLKQAGKVQHAVHDLTQISLDRNGLQQSLFPHDNPQLSKQTLAHFGLTFALQAAQ